MQNFLLAAAGLITIGVALGLARILRGPDDIDRMMATQLLGTGSIGTMLLVANATDVPGIDDLALGIALLAALATVAFLNVVELEPDEMGHESRD